MKDTGEEKAVKGGSIQYIAPSDFYTIADIILEIEVDNQIIQYKLSHKHPVRSPAKYAEKMPSDCPLITGQRVLDGLFPLA